MRLFVAIIVSIALHLGVYFYLINSKELFVQDEPHQPKGKLSTSIQYVKIKPKQTIKKIATPKKPITKKQKKPKIIELPKEFLPKKQKPVPIKKSIEKTPQKEDILKNIDPQTKEYIELYDNFEQFPQKTKLFLIENIKDIGFITQKYLIYPMMSVQAAQEGVNVVEFILYPNGSITVPRIVKSSRYFLLDDNTIETIQEAYKDYPRPPKPTPIRIFVKYKLIRN